MDPFRLIADRRIEEAMAEGAFDNLSGTGRPIPLDDDPFEDASMRMAHRLLRNNGFAPAWIEEGKEIEAAIAGLQRDFTQGRIDVGEYRRQAQAINRRILAFNLKAPNPAHK